MKKLIILIFGVLLVGFIGYFGWQWNSERQNQLIKNDQDGVSGENSQFSGVLLKNNPGMAEGVWFLLRDVPGSPAAQSELSFDDKSECYLGSRFVECKKIELPNGTRVRIIGNKNNDKLLVKELTAEENSDLISVDAVTNGDKIQSPITLTGKARGNWFFEASFPIRLKDLSGNVITTTIAQAQSDWMTTEFVPFSAKLEFKVTTDTPAELVFAADNPSGLPQNDRDLSFKVTLIPSENIKTINLYYYNPELDKDESGNILCSEKGLVSVKRQIEASDQVVFDAVRLLLEGKITDQEKKIGITSEFPLVGLNLKSVIMDKGVATVNLEDPNNKTSGGSCRVGVLWKQIEKTVKQFPGVQSVKFNPEFLFQP
jgi:hypothetical protein